LIRLAAITLLFCFTFSCAQLTRLSEERITGENNFIFVRPFANIETPEEVAKLVSEQFYTKLEEEEFFRASEGKKFRFDFYMGQPCPDKYACYYITGEVKDYEYVTGCCGNDGVEVTATIRFWDDMTKKPLFEISEWNNEIFEPGDLSQLQAIGLLAEDSADSLVKALLRELSNN